MEMIKIKVKLVILKKKRRKPMLVIEKMNKID